MGSSTSNLATSSSPNAMSSKISQLVDSTIDENFVTVFSKSWCPYCRRAKNLLNSLELPEGKNIQVLELDLRDDGSQIQSYLARKTGQTTVPNIFINREHIGGSDDLVDLHKSGKLVKLLNQ
ncbi:SubName: Full=Probable GRX1-glutaredoxin {ECO:0000313/EMBL:CCA67126.1} [Serendipita indica DSM 11827]|uniref:glutathione peroxidase n=1 Tax=Serendipita indica (strain DSM 11827) TaxID=1109443 RepID=G4T793_SERID|nr:SubName: Full=Probable GRX1-glutaredoxin {ECO:0000313/EMBL:CCA67126.1} [Serendipita indica DSM 11827]CCA67126.1 probable GRX1-glutaredoxin [Serendipita indica DSM 11827]